MVDLDSDPTKLIEIVEIGKQLLITRGSLTTFSIANDVAKYFAIIPAIFAGLYATNSQAGPLAALNVMGLHSPESAILSAVIFNALIIIVLIPLALLNIFVITMARYWQLTLPADTLMGVPMNELWGLFMLILAVPAFGGFFWLASNIQNKKLEARLSK